MRLFDLHCDTLTECYRKGETLDFCTGDVDLSRGEIYEPWCQVFAVWLSDAVHGEAAWRYCLRVLTYARRSQRKLADRLRFVSTRAALHDALDNGQTVGILGVENGAALGGKAERVRVLAALGVRVLTLTWNGQNELGNGCMSGIQNGLTPCGKAVLQELEKHRMIADVSHLNEAGFWDVADRSQRPFIASHSVSSAVNDHVRNLTDKQFCAVRDHGGVVGITLCETQLGEQSFDCLYRHVMQYLSLGGDKTVALGFDLDGTFVKPALGGIKAAERFGEFLLRRGLDEKTVNAVLFDNAYRFFSQVLP
ncbi:MAG: membrane dipeptidase [Clostridia bacterium]|nr:membrane dipeptidase [Clostridia bacterium]